MKTYKIRIEEKTKKSRSFKTVNIPAGITFSELSFIMDKVLGLSGEGEPSFIFKKMNVIFEEGIGNFEFADGKYTYEDATFEHIDFIFELSNDFTYVCEEEKEHKYKVIIEDIVEVYKEHYPVILKYSENYPAHHIESINKELKEKYFYVHGDNQEIFKDELYDDFQKGKTGIPYLTSEEIINMDEDSISEIEETLTLMQEDFYEELDFKAMLMELHNRDELYKFSRLKGLTGVSTLKKDDLAQKLVKTMLSPEEVEKYFLYMSDEEIKTFERAVSEEKLFIPEEDDEIDILIKSWYAVPFGFLGLYISQELKDIYKSIDNPEFHQKRRKRNYFYCCLKAGIALYGIMPMDIFQKLLQRNPKFEYTESEIEMELYTVPDDICSWFIMDNRIYDMDFAEDDYGLLEVQGNKSFYIPALYEILNYATKGYDDSSLKMKKMIKCFCNYGCDEQMSTMLAGTIQSGIRMGQDLDFIFNLLEEEEIPIESEEDLHTITDCIMELWNDTRMQVNRGFKPFELAEKEPLKKKDTSNKNNVIDFNKAKKKYKKK